MTRLVRSLLIVTVAIGAVAPVSAAERPADDDAIGGDSCCFTNPRYSGVCEVTPAADETCADILAYLNNQTSVGKTYCGNTRIRGGWAQVECDDSGEGAALSCGESPPG